MNSTKGARRGNTKPGHIMRNILKNTIKGKILKPIHDNEPDHIFTLAGYLLHFQEWLNISLHYPDRVTMLKHESWTTYPSEGLEHVYQSAFNKEVPSSVSDRVYVESNLIHDPNHRYQAVHPPELLTTLIKEEDWRSIDTVPYIKDMMRTLGYIVRRDPLRLLFRPQDFSEEAVEFLV
jgi:hypothetical protein